MSFSIFIDGGKSVPDSRGVLKKAWLRWGRYLAQRHAGVSLAPSCYIHPDARIHPRGLELSIGARTAISPGVCIQGQVAIGDDSSVNAYSILVGVKDGPITIGNGVRIAPHVMMFASNHRFENIDIPIYKQHVDAAPITIEDDVWIAGMVMITAGVHIGRGSVIGAGAVVTKDIPPWSVAVGVPARVIKSRKD